MAQKHPEFADIAVPMASLPSEMSSRNCMMRRLIVDSIRNDPQWLGDDERNPPENGVLEREIKRVKNGKILLIPGSELTAGHGTTGQAKFWKKELAEVLQSAPRLRSP